MNCVTNTTTVCTPCINPLEYFFEIAGSVELRGNASSYFETFDRLLDKGIIIPNCSYCCTNCNRYVIANRETYFKYAEVESVNLTNSNPDRKVPLCCHNIYTDIENYLMYSEVMLDENNNDISGLRCCNGFLDCIDDFICWAKDYMTGADLFFRVLNKGIIESDQFVNNCTGEKVTGICLLLDLFKKYYIKFRSANNNAENYSIVEGLERILEKGIIIECIDGKMIFSSVETWLKFNEATAVPV